MIPYEEFLPLLPHEYSYALYLSYGFDLCMYDPMILNMVSKRYPRDEDYASDADYDSDSDFDDAQYEIPRWLFLNQEEEDSSLLRQESNHLKIIFGSLGKDSDLKTISIPPLNSIEPEFDGSTIKIGEIHCVLTAFKRNGDEGSVDVASHFVDFKSNTAEQNETDYASYFSDCNNRTNDEVRMELSKMKMIRSTFVEEIAKKHMVTEMENSTDVIDQDPTNQLKEHTMLFEIIPIDPDPTNQLQKHTTCSEIVPSTSIFVNDSATRLGANVIFNTSKPARSQRFQPPMSSASFTCGRTSVSPAFDASTNKELDPRQISFMDSKKFLRYGVDPFHSSPFSNGSLFALLDATKDFALAKPFLDLSVLEEMVDEMYLEDPRLMFTDRFSQIDDHGLIFTKPTRLMFIDLFSGMVKLLFSAKPCSTTSPEPPWELLRHGLQRPYDPGDMRFRKASSSFFFASYVQSSSCVRCPPCGPCSLVSCFGPELWAISFEALLIWFGLKFLFALVWAESVFYLC